MHAGLAALEATRGERVDRGISTHSEASHTAVTDWFVLVFTALLFGALTYASLRTYMPAGRTVILRFIPGLLFGLAIDTAVFLVWMSADESNTTVRCDLQMPHCLPPHLFLGGIQMACADIAIPCLCAQPTCRDQ